MLKKIRTLIKKSLNQLKSKEQLWKSELRGEAKWQEAFLSGKANYEGSEDDLRDLLKRLEPDFPFDEKFRQYVNPASSKLKVLDVGCGTISQLGTYWLHGPDIELYPIDPLADEYKLILSKLGIKPRFLPILCPGEKITEQYPDNFFDFVHAHNCLDHSFDPIKCFQEMFSVLKNNCYIYTLHGRNEGEYGNYAGLHQWDFDLIDGDFCISNKNQSRFLLKEYLPSTARIFAELHGDREIIAIIKKEEDAETK